MQAHAPRMEIIHETTHAFGTCGMSLAITNDLSTAGKLAIMALMFIGRVRLLSFLYTLGGKSRKLMYRYRKERVNIG